MNADYMIFLDALSKGGEEAAAQCLFHQLAPNVRAFIDSILNCNSVPKLTVGVGRNKQRLTLLVNNDFFLFCDLHTAARLSVLFKLMSNLSAADGFDRMAKVFDTMSHDILVASKKITPSEMLAQIESIKAQVRDALTTRH